MKKILLSLTILFHFMIAPAQINTERVMMIGRNALYFEDYVLAIQYFNQAISSKPYLAEAYYYRGMSKFMLDDFKGAEEDCTLCLERNPYWTAAYQLRGAARQNQDKFEGAAEDYYKSLSFMPEDRLTIVNMGIVNMEMKKFDVAEKYFGMLLKKFPDYSPGYLTRAQMFLEKKDTANAFADYNKAIEIDPFTSQSFSARGLLYLQQKQYDKALTDLDEAIKLDPYFEGNFINRGLVKYNMNNLRGAMEDYDRVIELQPNNQIARFNRGLLRAQVGENNKAIEDFDYVLKAEPDNYIALTNRAMLNIQINNYPEALSDLNKVIRSNPDFYQGIYTRSEIKKRMGNMRGAEQDFYLARNVESKVQRDVMSGKTKKLTTTDDTKATRKTTDSDLEKFNMLVVEDRKAENNTKYQSETRGKVQNNTNKVEMEPKFLLSYYEKEREVQRPSYYATLVDAAAQPLHLAWKLRVTNNEARLNELQAKAHFRSIENLDKKIADTPNDYKLYMARALDYVIVQDFDNAKKDLNSVIALQPDFYLAYFERAIVNEMLTQLSPNEALPTPAPTKTINPVTGKEIITPNVPVIPGKQIENAQIRSDYDKVISLNPKFYYAYFNRAELNYLEKNLDAAIADYDAAIQLEPRFGEAYYNRGIVKLAKGDTQTGLDDLRKAGELGIADAYMIIKRMQ